MNPLERVDNVVVHFDGAVDGGKVMPKGFEPFGFQVGEVGGNVGEEGNSSASRVLYPCHCNTEENARLLWTSPVS